MATALSYEQFDRDPGKARLPRVALVTGGIGGIGTAVCKQLADAGNRVVATYVPAEAQAACAWQAQRRAEGYDIAIIECDVTSWESCAAMARSIESTVGPVEV